MSVDLQITQPGRRNDLPYQSAGRGSNIVARPFDTRPSAPGTFRTKSGLTVLGAKASDEQLPRFTKVAPRTGLVSAQRRAVLAVLLDATVPLARCGHSVLKPLWVDEAMQRAHNMVRLVVELERQLPFIPENSEDSGAEYQVACDLAETFRSLTAADDNDMQPCFDALQVVVFNLIKLFGPTIGQVYADMSVERLTLPAYKRRALVLASCELVLNSLGHGLIGGDVRNITVTLCRTSRAVARLSVEGHSRGVSETLVPSHGDIISDLAAILESDVVYGDRAGGGTVAQISFPVAALI